MKSKYELKAMKIKLLKAFKNAEKHSDADGFVTVTVPDEKGINDKTVKADYMTSLIMAHGLLSWVMDEPGANDWFNLTPEELQEGHRGYN